MSPAITSPANPRVKAVVRLRDRSEREATGLTIVDGGREIRRSIAAGVRVQEAFVCDELVRSDDARAARDALADAGARLTTVSEAAFGRLAFGDRAEGIIAVVTTPNVTLSHLALPSEPLVLVLEAVEKPGNLGAILRSADGAGADAVIAADPRTDLYNPGVIRASLGTIFGLPVAAASSTAVRSWLRDRGVRVVAALVDAERLHSDVDLRGPLAIVLGSEASGLSPVWLGPDVTPVRIAMRGIADSLNVSVAAAVLLYEARRQRDIAGRP